MPNAAHLSEESIAAIADLMLQSGPADATRERNDIAIGHLATCETCRRRLDAFIGDDIALEIAVALAQPSRAAAAEDRGGELTARMLARLRSDVSARPATPPTSPEGIVGTPVEPVQPLPSVSEKAISPPYGNQSGGPLLSNEGPSPSRHRSAVTSARIPRSPRSRSIYRLSIGAVPLLIAASIAIVVVRERRTLDDFASPGMSDSASKVASPNTPSAGQPAAQTKDPSRLRSGAPPESSTSSDSVRASRDDSTRRGAGSESGPHFSVRETTEGLVIGLAAISRALQPQQALAVDSAISALKHDSERRAVIRYEDPSNSRESESWKLAERAKDYMEVRGVAPERIRLVRVQAVDKTGLPSRLDAVAIIVRRPRDQ